ncbi:MAG: hypothetical protein ACKVJU_25225 [Verrucomicrobiales bacterium]
MKKTLIYNLLTAAIAMAGLQAAENPQLFDETKDTITLFSFDDVSIPYTENLKLEMRTPERHEKNPVVTRGAEGEIDSWAVQFYGSVLRDHETGKFRMWYVAVSKRATELFVTPLFTLFFMAMFVRFATPAGANLGALSGFFAAATIAFWNPLFDDERALSIRGSVRSLSLLVFLLVVLSVKLTVRRKLKYENENCCLHSCLDLSSRDRRFRDEYYSELGI